MRRSHDRVAQVAFRQRERGAPRLDVGDGAVYGSDGGVAGRRLCDGLGISNLGFLLGGARVVDLLRGYIALAEKRLQAFQGVSRESETGPRLVDLVAGDARVCRFRG